jgi:hypothetical protein
VFPFRVEVRGVIPPEGIEALQTAGFTVTGGEEGRYTVSGVEAFDRDEASRKASVTLSAIGLVGGYRVEEG